MKLPGIRLIPVELEARGQTPAERAEALQQLLPARLARDRELAGVGDVDFDLVAFLQFECLDDDGGQPDGEAVAPFGDLHVQPDGYTALSMYIERPAVIKRNSLWRGGAPGSEAGADGRGADPQHSTGGSRWPGHRRATAVTREASSVVFWVNVESLPEAAPLAATGGPRGTDSLCGPTVDLPRSYRRRSRRSYRLPVVGLPLRGFDWALGAVYDE